MHMHILCRQNIMQLSLKWRRNSIKERLDPNPVLYDLDARFRIMDKFEPIRQVLTLAWPKLEEIAGPGKAPDLARQANDEMAELVGKYPDRFVSAIAVIPMTDMDEALKETDRAIRDLRFRGRLYIFEYRRKAAGFA